MRKIMICSGAGLSAESGISTFRDTGGLWENHKIEEVCDMSTFEANYIKVNEFYDARRKQLSTVEPNSAHLKIAELCAMDGVELLNYTTNVDDLLERAGCQNVRHIHGYLPEVIHKYGTDDATIVDVKYDTSQFEDLSLYPVKPNVVFFGEMAPMYEELYSQLGDLTDKDVLVVIGSSEQVVPFVIHARGMCSFYGTIHFVNKDERLCRDMEEMYATQSFNMSATEYFKRVSFDAYVEKEDE